MCDTTKILVKLFDSEGKAKVAYVFFGDLFQNGPGDEDN